MALQGHEQVAICRVRIGWLRSRSGVVVVVTPIFPVMDLDVSDGFYEQAGLDVERYEGGGFAFVSLEDEERGGPWPPPRG